MISRIIGGIVRSGGRGERVVRPSSASQPKGWQNGRKMNILKENSLPSTRLQNIWPNKKKNQWQLFFLFKLCNYCYRRPLWLLEQGAKKDPCLLHSVKWRRIVCSRFTDISEDFRCAQNPLASVPQRKTMIIVPAARVVKILRHRSVLGAFAKWRKATTTFAMSVRLSAWNNSAPTGRISIIFGIWVFFESLSTFIKIWQE